MTPNVPKATGPRSVEGKAISSMNALQHGIFAETPVLPGENPDHLAQLAQAYFDDLHPATAREIELVRILIRSDWQTRRYDRVEAALITKFVNDSGKPADEAIAEMFSQTKNSPLVHLNRRRQASQRDWFRALKELQTLQKSRAPQPAQSPAPVPEFVPTPQSSKPAPTQPAPEPTREAPKITR